MRTVICYVCLLLAAGAWAADSFWDGGGEDDNWMTPANWAANSVPATGDRVYLDEANGMIVVTAGSLVLPTKVIGPCDNAAGTVTLSIYGELRNPSYWYLGRQAGGQGVMNVYGIAKTRDFILAGGTGYSGVVNIYSGEMYIYGDTTSTGTFLGSDPVDGVSTGAAVVNLVGGTLRIVKLNTMGSNAYINITNGVMLLAGDQRTLVAGYAASQQIRAFGGSGVVQVDYNTLNVGMTTVYAFGGLYGMINAAAEGSTLYVPDGVYQEGQFDINKSLTIQSANGPSAAIIEISGHGIGITADNVTFDGFTIRTVNAASLLSVGKSVTGWNTVVDNVTIQNCLLDGGGVADGISVYGSSNVQVFSNKIANCQEGAAVYTGATTVSIIDNDIFENAVGVQVQDSEDQILLLSNGIYWNSGYGVQNSGDAAFSAVNNFWGVGSGPYHAVSNPLGTGNAVSDNVAFTPFFEGCSDDRWHICPDGDMNGDCKIDFSDLAVLAENWLLCSGPDCP